MSNTTTVVVGPGNTIAVSAPGPQGPPGTGGPGGVTDGDKGDITISSSGSVYTIDNDAVTFAKIQNITGPTILGRQNAAAGSVEQIGLAAAFTINGSKQLDLANALAASSTTLTAGTGLTGGGDLSANRTFNVAYGSTAATACEGNDARLSDARTPTAHSHAWSDITSGVPSTFTPSAHTHALADIQQGGATTGQVLEWSGSVWAPASITGGGGGTVTSITAGDGLLGGTITASGTIDCNFGTAGNTVCEGNDARLSDARTPTAHNHAASEITSGTLDIARIPTGSSSTTVCIGNDARLSDARTPSAHTHGLTDSYVGEIATAANQTYTIDRYVAVGRTITDIRIQSTGGTCSAAVKNGANTVGTVSVSSTSGGSSPSLSNATVSQNGAITLEISSNSSAVNVSFAIRYTAVTGAIS